jgi:hypothetical protein
VSLDDAVAAPTTTDIAYLYGCRVNDPIAYQHHPSQPKFPLSLGSGRFEIYDAAKYGAQQNGLSPSRLLKMACFGRMYPYSGDICEANPHPNAVLSA